MMRVPEGVGQGYWIDRISKAAPVVIVESPEAEEEVREFYEGQNIRIVRDFGQLNVPKPASVIEADTPRAEREVRQFTKEQFPSSSFRILELF